MRMRQVATVLRLGAEEPDRLDRGLDRLAGEREHLRRGWRRREEGARHLVDALVGRLRREHDGDEQLEHARVLELARRLRVGVAQRREERRDVGVLHRVRGRAGCAASARAARSAGTRDRGGDGLVARRRVTSGRWRAG
jgi:hypothetical protein